MNKHVLILAAILSVILVLGCAGCSELPVEERGVGSGGGDGAAVTPTATPNWVEVATPIRTIEPEVAASPIEPELEHDIPIYAEIYSDKMYLLYDVIALNYDLRIPAMIIDLKIDPDMYSNSKRIYSDYGSKDLITIKESYPDPRADLIITIIDRETGEVVEEHDFAQFTKEHEKETIVMRYPGSYQIEITGNNVDVSISISVPEANLVGMGEAIPLT